MIYKKFTYINLKKKNILFDQIQYILDKLFPKHFTKLKLLQFFTLIIGINVNYKAFRLIFNLPVNGQNTWSSIKSTKNTTNSFLFWKFFFFKKLFKKNNITCFKAEYLNIFFQAHFYKEWVFNKNTLKKNLAIRKSNKFIDVTSASQLHIINNYINFKLLKKLTKKKKNSKKKNIGFLFGFTKKYHKYLI